MTRRAEFRFLVGFLLLLAVTARAEPGPPSADEQETARQVARLIETEHFLKVPIASVSAKIHAAFVSMMDPDEIYLSEQDHQHMKRLENAHGTGISNGDFSAPWEMFNLLLKRKQEKIPPMVAALEKGEAPPGSDAFTNFVKKDIEIRVGSGSTREEALSSLKEDLSRGLEWTQTAKSSQLVEIYLDSAMGALDPHSNYMSTDTLKQFEVHTKNSFEGIGVNVAPRKGGGAVEIKSVIPGGGAAEEGSLRPGHRIVGASQDGKTFVDFDKIPSQQALQLISGEAGTDVYLKVVTEEGQPPKTIKVTRRRIRVEDGRVKVSVVHVQVGEDVHRIAVVDLPGYYSDRQNRVSVANDVYEGLVKVAKDDPRISGVIYDLRGNGGGSLEEVIDMIALSTGSLPVVQVTDSADQKKGKAYASGLSQIYDGPVMVVINKKSASASEIHAGALQDYGRALIVGDSSTFGKGSVQAVHPLSPEQLGAVKITIQGFFRPLGESTQKGGVKSHVVFPSGWDQPGIGEVNLPNVIEFANILPSVKVLSTHMTPELLEVLRTRHEQRMTRDPELTRLGSQVNEFLKISANPAAVGVEEKAKALLKLGGLGKTETNFGEDAYTKELLRMFVDYSSTLYEAGVRGITPDVEPLVDAPDKGTDTARLPNCPFDQVAGY